MAERLLRLSGTYRHFKGKEYTALGIAEHTENNELLVIYVSNEDGKVWARPYDDFMSEVDREKYPEANQKYRFMLVEE